MARPLRIEFDGAYYHILSRGNNKSEIFREEEDCRDFLDLLDQMNDRFFIIDRIKDKYLSDKPDDNFP